MNPSHSSGLGTTSPVLPSLQSLHLGGAFPSQTDYPYNGVFGPPQATPSTIAQPQRVWTASPTKRSSRSGLPSSWYDPSPRDSPAPTSAFEAFRRDAPSPPALSPPSSTHSGPTIHSHPYPSYKSTPGYPPFDPSSFGPAPGAGGIGGVGLAPSPPPPLMYGLPTTGSAPALSGYTSSGMPQFGSQSLASIRPPSAAWRYGNGLGGNGPSQHGSGAGSAGSGTSVSGKFNHGPHGSIGGGPNSIQSSIDDDIIPTAIVIKNIPFAVSRETLLTIIESLGAPLPYAFNYHHDNGVFRGLAFANFRVPEEAARVVAALNGYDVQGRKLRVEYKKVLQPGEKERIEREKAIKRMKSMQLDGTRGESASGGPSPGGIGGAHGTAGGMGGGSGHMAPPPPPLNLAHRNGHYDLGGSSGEDRSPPRSAASTNSDNLPVSLDLNDPTTLGIYNMVYMFKEDRMRDELALSRNLSPIERRIVHLVAQKLGLTSITMGENEGKHVVVTKEPSSATVPLRPTLTSSASATVSSSTYLSPYAPAPPDPLSPSALRIKKSMPDLRGFNGPGVARDPARSLNPQRSSGNLRDPMGSGEYSSMGASQGRKLNGSLSGSSGGNGNAYFSSSSSSSIPPVPPLPAGLGIPQPSSTPGSLNINTSTSTSIPSLPSSSPSLLQPGPGTSPDAASIDSTSSAAAGGHQPLRNPRGPIGETRGFGAVGAGSNAGNGGGQTLRSSASGLLRGTAVSSGSSVMGRRVSEEDEEESARTREELEI